jgi:PAS domain S-box-containing protein
MLVKDIVVKNPVKIYADELVIDTVIGLNKYNQSWFPVLDRNDYPVGVFKNFEASINKNKIENMTVGEIMLPVEECHIVRAYEELYSIIVKSKDFFFVVDDIGKFIGIITKRHVMKMYYEKLQYTSLNLNGVLNSVDSAVMALDKMNRMIFINQNAKTLLGIGNKDFVGMKANDLITNSKIQEMLERGEEEFSAIFEFRGKKFKGNKYPVKSDRGIVSSIFSLSDISEYYEIRDELDYEKNEKEILEILFENAYEGLVVVDTDGIVTMISSAYCRFLGLEDENVIGKHVTEVIDNTKLHETVKTGIAETAIVQKINGNHTIVSRIPVYKDGVITNAIGKVVYRNIRELDEIHEKIRKIEQQLENYKHELSQINKAKYTFNDIIGESGPMKKVINMARKAAYTNSNVLILGESGTGKELFAHSIHNSSSRRNKPFVKVNCAAIPDDLLESELFGYEHGAFTGAKKGGKIGKFEVADQGTIFLDEIGDMPMRMQAKLLRVIQEGEIEKIGATVTKSIDVRIIAATNRNIDQMIEEKKFRLDLYYRINVVTLNIPSLNERPEDIFLLCKSFIEKMRRRYLKRVDCIDEKAIAKLKKYEWPGNIRELENMIERAINIMDGETIIKSKHLPVDISEQYDIEDVRPLKDAIDDFEKMTILKCLEAVNYNKSKAAKLLGISRPTLYERLEKYNEETVK